MVLNMTSHFEYTRGAMFQEGNHIQKDNDFWRDNPSVSKKKYLNKIFYKDTRFGKWPACSTDIKSTENRESLKRRRFTLPDFLKTA